MQGLLIDCQVRLHLSTCVHWKLMRHEHVPILYTHPCCLSQWSLECVFLHCLLTYLNDYLLKRFVREHAIGNWPQQAEATNLWGQRIYPLTQISIHQAVSEGVNNKAAHLLSSPRSGPLGGCSWQWGQTIRSPRAPCQGESDSTPWFLCHGSSSI